MKLLSFTDLYYNILPELIFDNDSVAQFTKITVFKSMPKPCLDNSMSFMNLQHSTQGCYLHFFLNNVHLNPGYCVYI